MPTESRDPIYQAVRAAVLALPEAPADLAAYKMEVVPALWDYLPIEAEGGGVPITRAPSRTMSDASDIGVVEVVQPTPHRRILPRIEGEAPGPIPFRVGWDERLRTVAVWIP